MVDNHAASVIHAVALWLEQIYKPDTKGWSINMKPEGSDFDDQSYLRSEQSAKA